MAENTKIEWCDHTNNLWEGCVEVTAGCNDCYAKKLSHRWKRDLWGHNKPRMARKNVWNQFHHFQNMAKSANEMKTVFVGSMMDIFEKPMPMIDHLGNKLEYKTDFMRDIYLNEIVPATPNLIHLMLTKRPSNIPKYIPAAWKNAPPDNVMFGTSISEEDDYKLVEQLVQVEGKLFLSVEPMIGPIHLPVDCNDGSTFVDWVICGGESGGKNKRPMDIQWARDLRDECFNAGCPFFFKQLSENDFYLPGIHYKDYPSFPEDLQIRQFPDFFKKKAA